MLSAYIIKQGSWQPLREKGGKLKKFLTRQDAYDYIRERYGKIPYKTKSK